MPNGFVSVQREEEMTQQELEALIDARISQDKRRKWTRRLFYVSNNFSGGAWAPVGAQGGSPNGGTRSTGSTVNLISGVATLSLTAGTNKSCQVLESHGQDTDIFVGNDGVNEYWNRNTTVSCILGWGQDTAGMSGTPAADTYIAMEMNGYNSTLPMPAPPTADASGDPCVMLRAKMTTGAWELYQSQANGATARADALTGVRALGRLGSDNGVSGLPTPFKLEILYTPTAITAKVDGIVGVVAPNIIAGNLYSMSHVGAGCSVWTGSSGTASFSQMIFYNFIAETEFGL